MRKLFPIFLLLLLLLPVLVQAAGLVPCGGFELNADGNLIIQQQAKPVFPLPDSIPSGWRRINDSEIAKLEPACGVCDLFSLIWNVLNFFLYPTSFNNGAAPIPIIATILILIGGFRLLTATGNPEKLQQAKTILTATLVGLLIVYLAPAFLAFTLSSLGVIEWAGPGNWTQLACPGP